MTSDNAQELLLEYGNEIVLIVDLATQAIRAANGAATHRLGYAQNELRDRSITDIDHAFVETLRLANNRQGRALNTHNAAVPFLCASGERLLVSRNIVQPTSHPELLVVSAIPVDCLRRAEKTSASTGAQLEAILKASADGILLLDENGAITSMNRQFLRIWQISEEPRLPVDSTAAFELLVSRMRNPDAYRQRLAEIRYDNDEDTHDLLTLNDGRFIECRSRPVALDGRFAGRVFFFTDISQNTASDNHLKLTASVFSHANEGIVITNSTGKIIDVNATFSRITGYTREEVIGQNPRILKSGQHGDDFYQAMWHSLTARGYWQGEVWNRHKSGRVYAQRLSITAIRDADTADAPLHYVAFTSDVTESKMQQQQLERMAHYDALTGIPNRVLLADRLQQAIAHARRNRSELALIYLDIDGFKEVNDTHGHETGDRLLVSIAHRLRNILRESDTLARLGGDEFVAVLSDLNNLNECEAALTRLLKAAATPFEIGTHTLQLSASLGAALFPHDGEDAATLMRHADQAMYQAKQAGKNRYHLYSARAGHSSSAPSHTSPQPTSTTTA